MCFLHIDVELHNLDRHVQRVALRLWLQHTGAPECPLQGSVDTYKALVERERVRWGACTCDGPPRGTRPFNGRPAMSGVPPRNVS